MNSSFIQSPTWQAFQEKAGARCRRWHDQLLIQRQIPLGTYWLGSRCQFSTDLTLPDLDKKACFLRLEPLDETSLENLEKLATQKKLTLKKTAAVQPRQTTVLQINQDDEDILKGMKPKHRYNLRLAQKAGLATDVYSESLNSHFPRFWHLLSHTAARQGFRTHSEEYYRQMLQELEKENMATLIFVHQNTKDLAAMILITYQDTATYLHGASLDEHRELMAPYLLHWQAIQTAKASHCQNYDFWGTDAHYNEEKQEWLPKEGQASYGTTRFKLGFGGDIVNYPGSFDLILRPFCYNLYRGLRDLRGSKRAFS